jgi:hypothetical protein
MPAKKHAITDEERAKRIRETAREREADGSPEDFERAFKRVVSPKDAHPGHNGAANPRLRGGRG